MCINTFSPTQQSSCNFNKNKAGARISGSVKIPSGSESDLLAAVATAGPVAVAVDASSKAFRVCHMLYILSIELLFAYLFIS